jgi:hypothetical protein
MIASCRAEMRFRVYLQSTGKPRKTSKTTPPTVKEKRTQDNENTPMIMEHLRVKDRNR